MSSDSNIVDGHGADSDHPLGPELLEISNQLRRITELVVRTDAPIEALDSASVALTQAEAALAQHVPPWIPSVGPMPSPDLEPNDYFPFSPVIGRYNPLAAPAEFVAKDGVVTGRFSLGAPYEGPPGCVHGGVIAEIFDEMLGVANISMGSGAMTGTLTIVYRSPTPLYTELTLAAKTQGVDGRKVNTTGTIHAGDRLCAEAHGIFILVSGEGFVEHAKMHGGPAQNE